MIVNGMNGMFANQSFPTDRGALVFGRSASSCNILFPDNTKGISRMHCKIEQNGAMCTIIDLGSSYGTFLNGMKIQPYAATPLKNGDTFYLGDKSNLFTFQDPNAAMVMNNTPYGGPVTYLNGNVQQQNPSGNKSKKIIIGVSAAAAVLVIGIVAFVVSNNIKKQEEERIQAQQQLEQQLEQKQQQLEDEQRQSELEKMQIEQQNQQLQQQLYEEQNKGVIGNAIDAVEAWFD